MADLINLTDSDIHFQFVIDALTSHIAILDEQGTILAVNQAWRKFGAENHFTFENSGVGSNYLDVCDAATGADAEIAAQVASTIRRIQKDEISESLIEYPCHSAEEQRWFQAKISRFMAGKSKIIVIHQNITARKMAEEMRLESEWLFRSVIEQSSEGIAIIDFKGKIIEWNQREEVITGFKKEEVMGRYIWDIQMETSLAKDKTEFKKYLKRGITHLLKYGKASWANKPNEVEIVRADGTRRIMQSVIFPIKHNHGFLACSINRDVTDFKQALKDQKFSESRYRTYVNHSPVIAFIIDPKGNFINVNPEACTRLDYSEAEFQTMNLQALIPTDQMESSRQLLKELLEEGLSSSEIQIQKRDKSRIILSSNAAVLPGGEIMIMGIDVTESKHTQQELQKTESFLKNILDNIPSMITVKEATNHKFIKVNRATEEFFKVSEKEIYGKTLYEFLDRKGALFFTQQDKLAIKNKQILDIPMEKVVTKDNRYLILHEKKIPLLDNKRKPQFVLSIADDITDQVNLELEANAHVAKLEAVSQLSTRLLTIQTLDELYSNLLEILMQIIHAEMGSIWIYASESDELVPVHYSGGGTDYEILVGGPLKPGKGILGMVFLSQKPYITRDYNSDIHLSINKRGLLHKRIGGVTLPLRTTTDIIGVVNLSTTIDREITDQDVKILITLSEIAGNAIQNISLREQTEQRLRRLMSISTIEKAITSNLDLQTNLEIIISNVMTQLKVDAADILLFNPHSQLLEFSTGQGFYTQNAYSVCLRIGESFAGKAALTHDFVAIENLMDAENLLFQKVRDSEKFLSYFGVPLIAQGQLKGVLEVFNRFVFKPDEDWINYCRSLAEQASVAIDNTQMFENLQRSNTELSLAYNATIEGWSHALDLRDKETEGHTLRVTELTEQLARAFQFQDRQIKYIRWGALLHDIGKLGVPDGILLKQGPLTEEEWVIMRKHPTYAYDMLSPIGYLSQAIDIPYCHHEKWDGTGYPRGLSGEQIPLAARIFAVVDIWDALRSDRPYRSAWPDEKVIEHIRSLSGTHLDPKVVDFCLNSGFFNNIKYS